MKVYLVEHFYEYGKCLEYDEVKTIGIFSSKELAQSIIKKYHKLPGFRDYPIECFNIDEYEIDTDHWTEGFIEA